MFYENYDLELVITSVKVVELKYDPDKAKFLIEGFTNGFDIGYEGNTNVKMESANLKLRVGSKTTLWNKVMREVKLKRYTRPYSKPPFDNYIQSPIRLVSKDNSKDT